MVHPGRGDSRSRHQTFQTGKYSPAWWFVGVPVAAAVAFVLVTAGLVVYERKYAVAAGRVRDRLA